jgi:hypothetical protein
VRVGCGKFAEDKKEKSMSGKNGDKARFDRMRKKRTIQRTRSRELVPAPGLNKKKSAVPRQESDL